MAEKMLLARGKKENSGTTIADLSKAFQSISHDPLIPQLKTYGFNQNTLNVIHIYLFRKSHKNTVGSSFNDLIDML